MATSNQKFLLFIEKDEFFKRECDFIIKKWNLDDKESNNMFFSFKNTYDLPVDYRKDIEFILWQSKLFRRYTWPLHRYLISGVKPKELPKNTRIGYLMDNTDIESMSVQIDADASREDIDQTLKEFTKMKEVLLKSRGIDKKQQPIKNFEEAKKVYGSNSSDLGDIIDPDNKHNQTRKKFDKAKNRLDVKQHRYRKTFSSDGKISVSKRDEYEKYIDSIDPGF